MSDATADRRYDRRPPRRPLRLSWSDERVRGIVWQVLVVALIGSIIWWLWSNTVHNLEVRRIATGFGFLNREAGLPIGESLIPYEPTDTYLRALIVGVLNTLNVAVVGVVLATILGTIIGIARLSKNWLVSRIAATYVEIIRDLPLLLQLLFWYTILQGLPSPRQALNPAEGVFLSNRGLKLPALVWESPHTYAVLACIAGIIGTWLYARAARTKQMADGQPRKVWPTALALILGLPVVVWAAMGAPWAIDWPVLGGFNFRGGMNVSPEYFALLIGLVDLHRRLHRRDRARRHPGGERWAMGGGAGAGPAPWQRAAADRAAAGAARHHPADDQPVPEPDQELLAGGGDRLPGHRLDRQHHAEPDRPGDRGHRHHHGGLPDHQPVHLPVHELVQCPNRAGGTVRSPT